jgi:hypothetical protein
MRCCGALQLSYHYSISDEGLVSVNAIMSVLAAASESSSSQSVCYTIPHSFPFDRLIELNADPDALKAARAYEHLILTANK